MVVGLAAFSLVGGGLFYWLGPVWMLTIGWILVPIAAVVGGVAYCVYNYGPDEEIRDLARPVMLGCSLGVFGATLFMLTMELFMFIAGYVGYGWAIASMLGVWVFPPTGDALRGLLTWLFSWNLDMMMVWLEEKSSWVCHRVSKNTGWGYFWGKSGESRRVLRFWVDSLAKEIRTNSNYHTVKMPRRSWSFGWMVPPEAVKYVYEGIMHDPEHPQCVSHVNNPIDSRAGLLDGISIIDTVQQNLGKSRLCSLSQKIT
jgi:hypothetical protein